MATLTKSDYEASSSKEESPASHCSNACENQPRQMLTDWPPKPAFGWILIISKMAAKNQALLTEVPGHSYLY